MDNVVTFQCYFFTCWFDLLVVAASSTSINILSIEKRVWSYPWDLALCDVMFSCSLQFITMTPKVTWNSWKLLRKEKTFTIIHVTRAMKIWENRNVTALNMETLLIGMGNMILWKPQFQKRALRTKLSTFLRPHILEKAMWHRLHQHLVCPFEFCPKLLS